MAHTDSPHTQKAEAGLFTGPAAMSSDSEPP